MTITQIAQWVLDNQSVVHIRLIDPTQVKGSVKEYDCKPMFQGSRNGRTIIDVTTANAIMTVYRGLREDLRPKLDTLPLVKLIEFCWRMAS